jgi:23S rRNA pseudouridine2605 synthase
MRDGRVRVDGAVVRAMGTQVDPATEQVTLDGVPVVRSTEDRVVIVVHKPVGVVTTVNDPEGRETVLDLLPSHLRATRLYPIGRLDLMSEGLVLLTNDGDLANQLMHPSFGHEREYEVEVRGDLPRGLPQHFSRGVAIGDTRLARAQVRAIKPTPGGTFLRLILREGRNHQIRRMFESYGLAIRRLRRIRVATVCLGELPAGRTRMLSVAERTELVQQLNN